MTSILTNNGAMVALQTLKSINSDLETTQSQISTGKNVATAKDNSAVWAISKVMESDVQGFQAVSKSLSLGESTVSVARGAAESVTDTLKLMKEEIVAAQDGTVDRAKLQERVAALRDQINSTTSAAQLNGINLVKGVGTTAADGTTTYAAPADLSITSSLDRNGDTVKASQIAISGADLSDTALKGMYGVAADGSGGTELTLAAIDVSTEDGANNALEAIEGMIKIASDAGAEFGSAQSRIETQSAFVSKLSDAMTSGIGSLVDADMEEASARLKALQTQQQLGVQALSIANQAPGAIMALFR